MNIEIRKEKENEYFETEAMVKRAFGSKFDYLNKAIRPLQWTYPNANDEENGYEFRNGPEDHVRVFCHVKV